MAVAMSSTLKQPLLAIAQAEAPASAKMDAPRLVQQPQPRYDGALAHASNASFSGSSALVDPSSTLASSPSAAGQSNGGRALSAAAPARPPIPAWQRRAEICVRGFERRKTKKLRRKDWGICTLAFPNAQQERMFGWYCAQIREKNMRGSMLVLAFLYMLYATVEWKDAGYSLTVSRGVYVVLVLFAFFWSYARRTLFRVWIQEWTALLVVGTSLNILVEAMLLRAVFSPFVVIVLLLFLLSSSVIVRLRFVYTSVVCWGTLLVYDLICIVHFRDGDDFVSTATDGPRAITSWLAWYNFVILFTILVVQKIAHRVEIQSRYEFLTTMLWTEKRRLKRKKRKQARREARMQQQYAIGAAGTTPTTTAVAAAAEGADGAAATVAASSSEQLVSETKDDTSQGAVGASAASAPSARGGGDSGAGEWSDSDYSDDENGGGGEGDEEDEDDDDEEEEELLMGALDGDGDGNGDGTGIDSTTLQRWNASLQKTLHDLLFTPATARQRARIEEEEEEEKSFDGIATRRTSLSAGNGTTAAASAGAQQQRPAGTGRSSHDSGAPGHGQVHGHGHGHLAAGSSLDEDVPVDQMSRITKALAESGVGDMAAFLRVLASKPDQTAQKRTVYATTSCDDLPSYFLAYPNIIGGYRVNFTAQLCAKSLFKWHNETLNVWSEFIPALMFFVMFWSATTTTNTTTSSAHEAERRKKKFPSQKADR